MAAKKGAKKAKKGAKKTKTTKKAAKTAKKRAPTSIEALTLFFETATPSEVARRYHREVFRPRVEVPVG